MSCITVGAVNAVNLPAENAFHSLHDTYLSGKTRDERPADPRPTHGLEPPRRSGRLQPQEAVMATISVYPHIVKNNGDRHS